MTKFSKCVVSYCGHRQQRDKECIYAKFPRDIERCRKWLKAVGDSDLVYLPPAKLNEIRYVCGCHFTDDQFSNSTRKHLKKIAVPSLIDVRVIPCADDLVNQYPLPSDIARTPAVAVQVITQNTSTSKTTPVTIEPVAEQNISVMETDISNEIESAPEIVSAVTSANTQDELNKAADGGACGLKRYRQSEKCLRTFEYRYNRAKPLQMTDLSPVRDENSYVKRTTLRKSPRGTEARSKEHIVGRSFFSTTSPSASPLRSNKIQRMFVKDCESVLRENEKHHTKNIYAECKSTGPDESRIFLPQHGSKYDEIGLYVIESLKKLNPVLADKIILQIKEIVDRCLETR